MKEIFGKSLINAAGVAASSFISFLISVAIARKLGVEYFGLYSLVIASASLAVGLFTSGVSSILIREVIKKTHKTEHYINYSLSIYLLVSLPLIALLTFILSLVINNESINFAIVATIYQYIFIVFGFFVSLILATYSVKLASLIPVIERAIFLLIVASLYFFSFSSSESIYYIFIMGILSLMFFSYVSMNIYKVKKSVKYKIMSNYRLMRKYIYIIIPVTIASIGEYVSLKIDIIMLGSMLSVSSVAIYVVTFNIVIAVVTLMVSLIQIYTIEYTKYFLSDTIKAKEIFYNAFKIVLIVSIIASIIIYSLSEDIVLFLYGDEYHGASSILPIMVLATPLLCLNRLVNYTLIAKGQQKYYLFITLIGSSVNIILNYFLIPEFGIKAAIFSTITTELIVLILGWYHLISTNRINYEKI